MGDFDLPGRGFQSDLFTRDLHLPKLGFNHGSGKLEGILPGLELFSSNRNELSDIPGSMLNLNHMKNNPRKALKNGMIGDIRDYSRANSTRDRDLFDGAGNFDIDELKEAIVRKILRQLENAPGFRERARRLKMPAQQRLAEPDFAMGHPLSDMNFGGGAVPDSSAGYRSGTGGSSGGGVDYSGGMQGGYEQPPVQRETSGSGRGGEGGSERPFTKVGDYKGERITSPQDSGDLSIMGPPTISARVIDEVLAENGSPMAGQGQEFFDRCVAAGVDPAIALGFFSVESTYGTAGLATENMNFGNIRADANSFRSYDSWLDGLDDWLNLMTNEYVDPNGFDAQTVDEAIPIYAPVSDGNDPATYIGAVRSRVQDWRDRSQPDIEAQEIPGKNSLHAGAIEVGDDTTDFFFTQFAHEKWNPDGPAFSSDCGPATLAMACKYYGIQPNGANMEDPNSLIAESRYLMTGTYGARVDEYGNEYMTTGTDELANAAAGLGMQPEYLASIDDIDAALARGDVIAADGNPAAYNYNMTASEYATQGSSGALYNGGHLVLLVAGDGQYYQLNDPAYKGEQLIISREELINYLSADGNSSSVALRPPQ
jgi:hypothetical protein